MAKRRPLGDKIKDAIPLQNHWESFLDWLLDKSELFANKYRYTLTARMLNLAFDIQEKIIRARFSSSKLELLQQLYIELEILASFLRRCYNKKLLSAGALEYSSLQLSEAKKMVAGWRKYQAKVERDFFTSFCFCRRKTEIITIDLFYSSNLLRYSISRAKYFSAANTNTAEQMATIQERIQEEAGTVYLQYYR